MTENSSARPTGQCTSVIGVIVTEWLFTDVGKSKNGLKPRGNLSHRDFHNEPTCGEGLSPVKMGSNSLAYCRQGIARGHALSVCGQAAPAQAAASYPTL